MEGLFGSSRIPPREFTSYASHNYHWSRNARSGRLPTIFTDSHCVWIPVIYGFFVIRFGAQLAVRSLLGFQGLQWLRRGEYHNDPAGMLNLGRSFFMLSRGSVFSSKRAVPSTSSCNPFCNRSLINITSRLCLHFTVFITTACACSYCILPGFRTVVCTNLLNHTHIDS